MAERECMTQIAIRVGSLTMQAELNDTQTARQVADALPLRSGFSTWGDEIYFAIPIAAELESDARDVVEMGDLGYWPPGNALCIFFGPTPMSQAGEIRPASAVNLIGKVIGDATQFKAVMQEREVILEAV
jgi:uncharacterized protein